MEIAIRGAFGLLTMVGSHSHDQLKIARPITAQTMAMAAAATPNRCAPLKYITLQPYLSSPPIGPYVNTREQDEHRPYSSRVVRLRLN